MKTKSPDDAPIHMGHDEASAWAGGWNGAVEAHGDLLGAAKEMMAVVDAESMWAAARSLRAAIAKAEGDA